MPIDECHQIRLSIGAEALFLNNIQLLPKLIVVSVLIILRLFPNHKVVSRSLRFQAVFLVNSSSWHFNEFEIYFHDSDLWDHHFFKGKTTFPPVIMIKIYSNDGKLFWFIKNLDFFTQHVGYKRNYKRALRVRLHCVFFLIATAILLVTTNWLHRTE